MTIARGHTMQARVDRYRKCAEVCATTDYSRPRSLQEREAAVKEMYLIVEDACALGGEAIGELLPLLEEQQSALWLAHQLLEKCPESPGIEGSCLRIIESAASGKSADALGEQMWLRDYKKTR